MKEYILNYTKPNRLFQINVEYCALGLIKLVALGASGFSLEAFTFHPNLLPLRENRETLLQRVSPQGNHRSSSGRENYI